MKTLNLNDLFNYLLLNKLSHSLEVVDPNLTTLEIKTEARKLYFNIIKYKNKIKIYYIIYDELSENHVFLKLKNEKEIIYILRNLNQ